ncbi:MAG: DUF1592 domain-containing protein [Myxococcota bacterium]
MGLFKLGGVLLVGLSVGWLGACTGTLDNAGEGGGGIGPGPGPGPGPITCDPELVSPGRAPLQRMTVEEYDNTVRDLLGDTSGPALRLVDNERGVVNADARVVDPLLAEQYMFAAEDVAARATEGATFGATLGCDVAATGEEACARQFIADFGGRAYRRPLSPEEEADLFAVYTIGRDGADFEASIRLVIEATLQSPFFLYRVETGFDPGQEIVRLDGYQLATRLSYFLWRTMPDPTLFAAAEAGELSTAEGVESHVRRMLGDPQAEGMIQGFFSHYIELEELEDLQKDETVFPTYNDGIRDLFHQETEAFVRAVVIDGDGDWRTLLSAPWSMMNADLAAYYGVTGPSGDGFERVDLDPAYHAGILTQGSLMATRARAYETSPIHRGMFIRGTLLCHNVPDVPEGLNVTPPDPDENLTTRERLAEHRADPTCASCHAQIDPLGFAFEHFDGAGRFRDLENGMVIDASGEVSNSDIEGSFDGAVELAAGLVGSAETQACFAKRWFQYGAARSEQRLDSCTIERLADRFAAEEFDIRELIVGFALSDAFLYRAVDQDTVTEGL